MLNITAHGNIGRDPEIKDVGSSQVCNFSLAARTGKDETTWINCTVWGKRADAAMQYLRKGSAITVAGRGKLRTYQKKDGSEGQTLEMDVNEFTLPPRESNSEMPF
jgi:single-strand DNA-binding protein